MTKVLVFHYIRLIYRGFLFIGTLILYISDRINGKTLSLQQSDIGNTEIILAIVWVVFIFEMIMRMIPSKIECNGSQKQFARNYIPSGKKDIRVHDNNATIMVVLIWILLNAGIGALYQMNIIDQGILLLVSLAYSVCDIICILFFCPFQSWFLKNKCCSACRIYNWDYAMMFTPLFFIPGKYTWSLLFMSVILLIRWEITVWRYPERFSENTNQYLACKNCNEKLCSHKKQLSRLWKIILIETKEHEKRILKKPDR
ncbi:MAG: hypothetical protein IJ123_06270 [Blautia sp.]|nr:hypothetical protein [Blautia sp.]